MALTIPDHCLWLGLGVFTFLAIRGISSSLHTIQALTTVHKPVPNPPKRPSANRSAPAPTHQEDAIKTSSLLVLATSHNIEIRSAATKILCTRFVANSTAKKLLLRDLRVGSEDVKRRARLAVELLEDMGVWLEEIDGLREGTGARELGHEEWRVWGGMRGGAEGTPAAVSHGLTGAEQRRELRRRRREAVVIHDGDGAVGRGDLYMRDERGDMGGGLEEFDFEPFLSEWDVSRGVAEESWR